MKKCFIILFLLANFVSYSQNNQLNTAQTDSIIKSRIEEKIKPYLLDTDSLKMQIEKYKLNENYYTTALSAQTTIFSLIVTLLLVIIGFISYSKFKSEVKDVNGKYQQSIENYNKIEIKFQEAESDLYFALAAIHYKENLKGESVRFFARSLSAMSLSLDTKENIIANISSLVNMINKFDKPDCVDLNEHKKEIFKYLNSITIDDTDILNELAKLRTCVNEKMNNA